MENKTIHIEGTVEQVMFRNDTNGYIVFDLDSGGELITVVGEIGSVDEGEVLLLDGNYVTHSRYGTQFKATYCERKLPADVINIRRYLSSGAIKGIGPSLAKKIVDVFGTETLDVMANSSKRLLEIKGISPKKCEDIASEVKEIFALRSIMSLLTKYEIPSKYAMRTYKKYGSGAKDMLCANPYLLCSQGIELEFKKAEQLAVHMNMKADSPQRIAAGIEYILSHNLNNGFTCVPLEKLEAMAVSYLHISVDVFYSVYSEQVSQGELAEYIQKKRSFVYLPDYYRGERYIADRIQVCRFYSSPDRKEDYEALIDSEERQHNIKYESLQRKAIIAAMTEGIMIMTGGPGTGKTTAIKAILSLYSREGSRVMLAAPTGRAAQRMTELTGYPAKTIHRLLEVEFDMTGQIVFRHNENNTLPCDVIIVDEMSMVDTALFEALLRGLRLGCKVVLVGDTDQLPSVGAGNVLGDMISSGLVPVVRLNQVFRQAQESSIITNAHKIINGEEPDLTQKKSDFFFLQRLNVEEAAGCVAKLASKRLPEAYDYSVFRDIQVICPSRKGLLGSVELNKRLQMCVNPSVKGKAEFKTKLYTFREGDKVMQMKNNYDIIWKRQDEEGMGIFNGDIGKILSINVQTREAVIDFDLKRAVYSFELMEQMELAYAITVHKSQGSEFSAVIMPVLEFYPKLNYRKLLYTAVTRARKLFILVGSKNATLKMVENNRRTYRYTGLKNMIRESKNED